LRDIQVPSHIRPIDVVPLNVPSPRPKARPLNQTPSSPMQATTRTQFASSAVIGQWVADCAERFWGNTNSVNSMVAGNRLFIKIPNQKFIFKRAAVLPTRKDKSISEISVDVKICK